MDSELEKAVTFFRFEDLRIYHKAIDYIEWVTIKTSQFPNDNQASIGGVSAFLPRPLHLIFQKVRPEIKVSLFTILKWPKAQSGSVLFLRCLRQN